jgi:hypothetical protein
VRRARRELLLVAAAVRTIAVRCRVTGAFPVLLVGIVVVGTIGFCVALATGEGSTLTLTLFGLGVAYWWFSVLYQLFYEITLFDDGLIELKSVFRRREVKAADIDAIEPRWNGLDLYTMSIKTRHGNLHMIRAMSNMFELGTRLRELNPNVDLSRF